MYDQGMITFSDVVASVVRYLAGAAGADHEDTAAFLDFECARWVGESWESADSWSMARDWVSFQQAQLAGE